VRPTSPRRRCADLSGAGLRGPIAAGSARARRAVTCLGKGMHRAGTAERACTRPDHDTGV